MGVKIKMAKFYDIEVSAHVTILESQIFTIEADNEQDARDWAQVRFDKWVNGKYPWCDYDESRTDKIDEYEDE